MFLKLNSVAVSPWADALSERQMSTLAPYVLRGLPHLYNWYRTNRIEK